MIERQHVVPSNVILSLKDYFVAILHQESWIRIVQINCIGMGTHNALQPYACVLCLSKPWEIRRLESQGYFTSTEWENFARIYQKYFATQVQERKPMTRS